MLAADYTFQLGAIVFGLGQQVAVETFDTGSADWRTQDADNPIRAGKLFGRDYLGAPTWAFDMFTDANDPESALTALSLLAKEWRGGTVPTTPGAVQALTYQVADRVRRVYGRPRKWAAPPDTRIVTGYIPITADFQTVDPLHYDETEQAVSVGTVPTALPGFITPLVAPIVTLRGAYRTGAYATVGGDAPTWPVITITGPITGPWVSVQGWRYELAELSLIDNSTVVIDTRPWVLTVMRDGIASVAGYATPSSRLDRMQLNPGSSAELLFGGVDMSGSATCTVRWRNAWHSL